MEQLYTVRICKFKSREKTEYGYRFIIDENSFQEFIGYKEGNWFINSEDGMAYRALKKNGNYIDQNENIEFDEYYVSSSEMIKEPLTGKKTKNYLIRIRNLIMNGGKQKKKTR